MNDFSRRVRVCVCVCACAHDVCNYECVAWRCRRGDAWIANFFSRRKVGKHLITSKYLGHVAFIDCGGGFKNGTTRSLFRRQSNIFHKWLLRVVWVGLKLSQQRPDHATICNIPSGIVYHKCWFGQEHTLSKHSALCQREQLPRREENTRAVFTANCKTSSLGGEQDAKSVKPAANNEQNFCLTELCWTHDLCSTHAQFVLLRETRWLEPRSQVAVGAQVK